MRPLGFRNRTLPSGASYTRIVPYPPMPDIPGWTTLRAAAIATAASLPETSIRVKADYDTWNVDHEIPISAKVDPNTAKASYNNGVLDVTLELIEETEPEGVDIQVN